MSYQLWEYLKTPHSSDGKPEVPVDEWQASIAARLRASPAPKPAKEKRRG